MTRPLTIVAGIVSALVLIFGAYMGAYYSMIFHKVRGGMPSGSRSRVIYRLDGQPIRAFLGLAHELDRLFRPGYWNLKPLPELPGMSSDSSIPPPPPLDKPAPRPSGQPRPQY